MIRNDILQKAKEYYTRQFQKNPNHELSKYITESREFNEKTIKRFGIGISPNSKGLVTYLLGKGYTTEEMLKYGLIQMRADLTPYDFLENRFIIEIKDSYGNLIGFAGRQIKGNKKYKYLNIKNTPLFHKKKVVFNLFGAKYNIDYENFPFIILVEGYCDVMTLYQNGIKNVVCTMGTACSEHQAKLIKLYTNNILICYDGDKAGQKATENAIETFKSLNMNVSTLCLPDNQDPDEFLKHNTAQDFLNLCCEKLRN